MTSLLPTYPQEKKWGMQPHCSISTLNAVLVLTTLTQLRFLYMHNQYENANAILKYKNFIYFKIKNFKNKTNFQISLLVRPSLRIDSSS
jgi:hypothetical protein